MSFRERIFGSSDGLPDPSQLTADDIERLNRDWMAANGIGPTQKNTTDDGAAAAFDRGTTATAKEDIDGVNYRSKFPWLYDPHRGVRWDFDPIELRNLAQENAWVQMLIQSIAKEIAETSWTITTTDDPRETAKRHNTHPEQREPVAKDLPDATAERIFDLLQNPNPDQTWHDIIEMWVADYLEVGSSVAIKAFPSSAYGPDNETLSTDPSRIQPRGLRVTAPEVWTKEYQGKTGLLSGFWQFENVSSPGGQTRSRGLQDPIEFDTAEVMWNDHSPKSNRRYGTPPTLAVSKFLKAINLAVVQEQEYLSRGSTPSGLLVTPDDKKAADERSSVMTEDVKGKPWKMLEVQVGQNDMQPDFIPFTYNFDEMQFTERQQWYAQVIAAEFQVPTAVVGTQPEKINYNTFQGERQNFEANTLGPYLQDFERWLTESFIKPHWGGYRFEFTPGMSESTRQLISDRVRAEWDANLRGRKEARKELGLSEEIGDEDEYKDDAVEGGDDEGLADVLGQSVGKADSVEKEFAADVFRIVAGDDSEFDNGTVLGIGVDFPNSDVYVDWKVDSWPGDSQLSGPHVSIYNTLEDAQQVAQGEIEPMDTLDADVAKEFVDGMRKAEYDVGGDTIEITPPDQMVNTVEAAIDADERLEPDCGTGAGRDTAAAVVNDDLGPTGVADMAQYLTSHEEDVTAEGPPTDWSDDEWQDCGNLQYALWGGVGDGSMKEWAQGRANAVADARGEDLPYPELKSGGDTGNGHVAKDEPLRNTDDYHVFDVQPSDVEALTEDITDDVTELFNEALEDAELQSIIDRLADDSDDTEKSVSALTRRLREILDESDVADSIQTALSERTTAAALEAAREASREAGAGDDVDIEAIRSQLQDRAVEFADDFAEEMAADIRETVAEGWADGENSRTISEAIAEEADINEGWQGAEKIARQELHIATGEARNEVADELDKVVVWETAGDDRVREAHQNMDGTWRYANDSWVVEYPERGVKEESVMGNSEPGIGCRCVSLLVDRSEVSDDDYAGNGDAAR